jgi:lipid-binding SYLF domain-containing protein
MRKTSILIIAVFILAAWGANVARAQDKTEADGLVDKSRVVIEEMTRSQDSEIPTDLLKQAAGIAIIPDMVKAGFIIGGSYGKGLVMSYKGGKWNGPAFIKLGAGSIGLQIGGQAVDLILVIVGEEAMNAFMANKFKLGGDVALVAGPVGAQASAATEITFKGGIYSYSRSKGLFAGISLEGAGISSQEELNRAYYELTGNTQIILAGKVTPPESGQKLAAALRKFK